jgi:hypothetical protein
MAEVSRIRSSILRASGLVSCRTGRGGLCSSLARSMSRRCKSGWRWKYGLRTGRRRRERLARGVDAPQQQQLQGFVEIGRSRGLRGNDAMRSSSHRESGRSGWARGIDPGAEWGVRFHRPVLLDQGQETPQHGAELVRPVVVFPIDIDLARIAGGELAGHFEAEDRRKRCARDARHGGVFECGKIVQFGDARRKGGELGAGQAQDLGIGRIGAQRTTGTRGDG